MKNLKKILIVLLFAFVMFLSACSVDTSEQDAKLTKLEDALDELQGQVDLYNEEIDSLNKKVSNYQTIITDLRTKIEEQDAAIEETNEALETLNTYVNVNMAEYYYLVVGDTFQLFYRSIIQSVDPYGYYIKLTANIGHGYNRYFEFTPTEVGTYDLKVEVCDDNGNVYGTDETKLIVVAKTTTDSAARNILCIGDSLTAGGAWPLQGYTKYISAGGKLNMLGTTTSSSNSKVKYEGIVGWQWHTFFTGDGTNDSPFKASLGSGISFKNYCEKNGYTKGIDEVFILLTWNGIGGSFRTFSFDKSDEIGYWAKQFIDQLHKDYPNCKVNLMSVPLPSVDSGLGDYYTLDKAYADNYGQLVTAHNYDNFLEQWCMMDEYKDFMRYCDAKGAFDTENGMPTKTKSVNSENSNKEDVGDSMGMHPNTSGYKQIGDTFYRCLMNKWTN